MCLFEAYTYVSSCYLHIIGCTWLCAAMGERIRQWYSFGRSHGHTEPHTYVHPTTCKYVTTIRVKKVLSCPSYIPAPFQLNILSIFKHSTLHSTCVNVLMCSHLVASKAHKRKTYYIFSYTILSNITFPWRCELESASFTFLQPPQIYMH